jgi:hypothetical protein
MSFSCEIKGKKGEDLLKKYDIQYQLLGIARNTSPDEDEDYEHTDLSEIRNLFCEYSGFCGDSITAEQSRSLIAKAKTIVAWNLECLKPIHCDSCKCEGIIPTSWSKEAAERFVSIPLHEVYKAYGGY